MDPLSTPGVRDLIRTVANWLRIFCPCTLPHESPEGPDPVSRPRYRARLSSAMPEDPRRDVDPLGFCLAAYQESEAIMSWISRRSFFHCLLSVLAVPVFPRPLLARMRQNLSGVQLLAVGQTVLPAELGIRGHQRIVEGFQQWLRGFRPEPEMAPGWGSAEVPRGPPDPTNRWSEQLRSLDEAALRNYGVAFMDLGLEERAGLLRAEIQEEILPLRSPAQAHHIAVGILSFFYRSPEATNLCYRATIHAESCRDLSTAGNKPDPLQSGR